MNRTLFTIWVSGLLIILQTPLYGQFHVEVPYSMLNGKLIVDAEVNGQKGRFLVDTGAPCAVTYSFFEKLKVGVVDSLGTQDSNGTVMQSKVVNVDSLKLGNTTFKRLQAICIEKGNMIESFQVDGIIGYNLLRMGIVKFDSKTRKLILSSSDKELGVDPAWAISLVKEPYLTRFKVKLGKGSTDIVMFDCGASGFYTMTEKSYFRLKNAGKDIKTLARGKGILSLGAAGIERPSIKYRLKVSAFKVGSTTFENVTSVTTSGIDSRMGSELMRYGEVIIDYTKDLFYFIPFEKGKTHDLYQKEWDVDITVVNGYLTAGMVWDYTQSSLKGGERIVEIDGRKYDKVDLYQATMMGLVSMPEDHAQIKYIDPATNEIKSTVIDKR